MATQKLIVNELLAFIQNALSNSDLDHDSIVQTCKINFKAEEISKAKTLLFLLLNKDTQILHLQECSQNLLDIINLFEKTDGANVPVFVAKQLNKLPLLLFERPSIQKLMMEVRFLKATLVEIKSKLVAAEINVAELYEQVYAMHIAELKQCRSQGVFSKDTDEVKSASNDTKLNGTPRPAPRTSILGETKSRAIMPTSWTYSNVTAVQPEWLNESDSLDLSKLDLKVDKNGFVKVKPKKETKPLNQGGSAPSATKH